MEFDVETVGGAVVWLVMMTLAGLAFYRAKTRRRHIGSGAAATIYDFVNDEKRNAIEIIAEDRAAERDEEHVDDDRDRTEKGRDR
jgi:hypothetical protein